VQRQKEQWQKDASYELARGDFKAGLDAYNERGFVHMAPTQDQALADLVKQYMKDRGSLNSSGEVASQAVIAHRNADVKAINEAIRNAIKERGELADGIKVQTAKGEREFASGDRLLFLKNDRELGVKNGSQGTVERATDGAMSVKLDSGSSVQFDPAKYQNFDHGYAFTAHKTQGASVDKAYAYMLPSNNHALSYVPMTRHKEDLHVYGSMEKFKSYDAMADRLGRRQTKESTLDYADSAAKLQATREQEREAQKQSTATAQSALGNRSETSAALSRGQTLKERMDAKYGERRDHEQQPQMTLKERMDAKYGERKTGHEQQGQQERKMTIKERLDARLEARAAPQKDAGEQQPKQPQKDQGHEM
jgi:hypothetical protein